MTILDFRATYGPLFLLVAPVMFVVIYVKGNLGRISLAAKFGMSSFPSVPEWKELYLRMPTSNYSITNWLEMFLSKMLSSLLFENSFVSIEVFTT